MTRISWHVVIGVLVLGLLGSIIGAATLNDFKNAENQTGCDSIPYDSIRATCRSNRDGVREWCKNSSRPISCDGLDPSGLTKQIENMKGKIKELKDELGKLPSSSDAKDDSERRTLEDKKKAIEDKIYELEKRVAEFESRLSNEKTDINNRIYNGDKCVDYRKDVARSFESARSSAKSESDPEIKPIAEKLVRYWESEEPNHAAEIRKYQEAVDRCKSMR
jgi:hypothetical protein